jgi:hypothetical protein
VILVGGAALTPPDRKSVVPLLRLGFGAISSPPSVDRLDAPLSLGCSAGSRRRPPASEP